MWRSFCKFTHRNSMENLAEACGGWGVTGKGGQIGGRFENRPYDQRQLKPAATKVDR